MSDDHTQPVQPEDIPEDDGVLDPGDSLETDDLSADPLDTGISPPERHPASERFGVTLAEARAGEPLDRRLAEEEPDFGRSEVSDRRPELERDEPSYGDEPPEPRTGRLLAADEGAHAPRDPEHVARDLGFNGGAASAEEAAMHVIDEDLEGSAPAGDHGDDLDERGTEDEGAAER
jgi:hypothetical protein